MQLPNVASLALIAAIVAALEFFVAGADGLGDAWWIPALVLVLGAVAKALQVYLQQEGNARAMDYEPAPLVRWLLD